MEILDKSYSNKIYCDECGRETPLCIRLGEEPYFESATAIICAICLANAVALLQEALAAHGVTSC